MIFRSRRQLAFIALFALISLAAYQVNFSPLLGAENQSFTFFQFFGPTAGMFLGPLAGAISVFFSQAANFFVLGREFSLFNIARLFPMLFAAWYFGARKRRLAAVVPVLCMALFIMHPVGMNAWFYSLYWLVPLIAAWKKDGLISRSLGATFTAHAVGSVAFLYAFPTVPGFWIALIPIVYIERIMFASGIALSYICFNTALSWLGARVPSRILRIDPRYVVRLNAAGGS